MKPYPLGIDNFTIIIKQVWGSTEVGIVLEKRSHSRSPHSPINLLPTTCAVLFFVLLVTMLDLILDYESDELDNDQIVELFQQIYDTKAHLWLQGHYGLHT